MVSLVEQGWADQNDVARAFQCSVRTVRRDQRRFEDGGLAALGQQSGYPKGRKPTAGNSNPVGSTSQSPRPFQPRNRPASGSQSDGDSQIAASLGLEGIAVTSSRISFHWNPAMVGTQTCPLFPAPTSFPSAAATVPGANPNLSAFSAANPVVPSRDTDPADRRGDRLLACLGLLEDAAPLFGSRTAVPRAGVLLALPPFGAKRRLCVRPEKSTGSLGPAFYGLRTSLLTLLLMALWRIKRPEGLKEHSPQDLGQV